MPAMITERDMNVWTEATNCRKCTQREGRLMLAYGNVQTLKFFTLARWKVSSTHRPRIGETIRMTTTVPSEHRWYAT